MSSSTESKVLARYQDRAAFCLPRIEKAPSPDLKLVVVIPVHDEPDIFPSLRSLYDCQRPPCSTEIILVINSSSDASAKVVSANRKTAKTASEWIEANSNDGLRTHILDFPDLPPKHAGVGLARKIGMDEAAARLNRVGSLASGIIICFDADCVCEANFLIENVHHFEHHLDSAACSTYFEHPMHGPLAEPLYTAVAAYELHLRYVVESLRLIRFPYALHTIGSSMSVKALAYLQHGGMNRRKAGEDFYFLQKLMLDTIVTELNQTTVFPSPRQSHRVPFGTGKAIRNVLEGNPQSSYSIRAFQDLADLVRMLDRQTSVPSDLATQFANELPASIQRFLFEIDVESAAGRIAENVSNITQFKKRFWQWFNGFRCIKYLNWASETFYPRISVEIAASEPILLSRIGQPELQQPSIKTLLRQYRIHQKQSNHQTSSNPIPTHPSSKTQGAG